MLSPSSMAKEAKFLSRDAAWSKQGIAGVFTISHSLELALRHEKMLHSKDWGENSAQVSMQHAQPGSMLPS